MTYAFLEIILHQSNTETTGILIVQNEHFFTKKILEKKLLRSLGQFIFNQLAITASIGFVNFYYSVKM